MTLKEVKVGKSCKVVKINGEGALKRRIMDMGITKGVSIFVRKVAPSPFIFTTLQDFPTFTSFNVT